MGTVDNLKARVVRLSDSLRKRARSYDRIFAGLEAALTAAGAILLATGGAVFDWAAPSMGATLLIAGGGATMMSLFLVVRRQSGAMAEIAEAVAAGHEAEAVRLDAENGRLQAEHERDEQKRLAEIAVAQAEARIAEAEKRVLQAAADAQARIEETERNAKAMDRQRRARLRAMRGLVETVEAALLRKDDVAKTAERLLQGVNEHIRLAVGVEPTDDFTMSIFRCEARPEGARMCRIGCYATLHKERKHDEICWEKGQGFTGTVWHEATANLKAELVIPDTSLSEVKQRCPVRNPDPEWDERYRSVAAYPIRIQRSQEVWGVVTATINRTGVFARVGPKSAPTQGVEMTEDIAYVAALLAGLGTNCPT